MKCQKFYLERKGYKYLQEAYVCKSIDVNGTNIL